MHTAAQSMMAPMDRPEAAAVMVRQVVSVLSLAPFYRRRVAAGGMGDARADFGSSRRQSFVGGAIMPMIYQAGAHAAAVHSNLSYQHSRVCVCLFACKTLVFCSSKPLDT